VPLTALLSPLLLLLTAANSDKARVVALLPHCTQLSGVLAWLIGRILSNLAPQSAHRYSYIGISVPHPTCHCDMQGRLRLQSEAIPA